MSEKKTTIKIKPKIGGMTTGKTTFKGGVHKTRKDRERSRKDKYAKRQKDRQIRGDE
jgi:hypothetical protein